jgi:hypothetical protein
LRIELTPIDKTCLGRYPEIAKMQKFFRPNSAGGAPRFLSLAFFAFAFWPHPARAGGVFIQPIIEGSPMIKKGHLEAGINGDAAPRKDGKTPLMLAVEAHQIEVIDYLLEHGADLSLKDAAGETAIDIAHQGKSDDVARKLDAYIAQHPDSSLYYAARAPTLYIVSGQNQSGAPDCGGPKSMVVYAMGTDGRPLVDAPIKFSVEGGGKHLVTQASSPDSATLLLRTDEYGICMANIHLPNTPNTRLRITASAGTGDTASTVTFNATTNDGKSGDSVSSFNPTNQRAVLNADGTVSITWQNQTDDETAIRVWMDTPQGMKAVVTVPPHSTSAHISLH